ncbi:MAG: FAD-dependent oxidoreductase [bacterium]
MLMNSKQSLIGLKPIVSLIIVFAVFLSVLLLFSADLQAEEFENKYYPLIVYGGEPEAVMAAIAAARQGLETVILLDNKQPGGLMTYGGLNFIDINHGPDGRNINKGLFAEWHNRVGGNISFSISKATEVFEEMLQDEKKIKIYRDVQIIDVNTESKTDGNQVSEIVIESDSGISTLSSNIIIDGSKDGDLAYLATAPFFSGGADIGLPDRHMAVTLVLHIADVDWNGLAVDVRSNKFGPSFMSRDHAWGFVEIGSLYQPVDPNTKMRGLNIVIEEGGELSEVYINALLIFDVNPSDPESLARAHQRGEEEAVHVLEFLRENLAGFENARLLPFPEELYIRETRHLIAEKQLKVEDVFNNRIPEDTIALASYPLDYQASSPNYNGFVLFNPAVYGVSLRSTIPRGWDNLMVVGKASGYSSLAASSARVLPTGMSTAEAAGILSAVAVKNQENISQLIENKEIVAALQNELRLTEDINKYKAWEGILSQSLLYKEQNIAEDIEYLLSWGLIIGGYNNDFRLETSISEKEFAHIIIKGLKQQSAPIFYEWVPGGLETMSTNDTLTRDRAAMLLLVAISQRIVDLSSEEIYQKAIEHDLIPEIIQKNIEKNRLLSRREAYILLSAFLQEYHLAKELKYYRGED